MTPDGLGLVLEEDRHDGGDQGSTGCRRLWALYSWVVGLVLPCHLHWGWANAVLPCFLMDGVDMGPHGVH